VSPRTTAQPTPKTLLVVDDDSDVRDVLEEVLQDAGYAVVCAEHGQEALAYLRTRAKPDAILLDLFMPVMSGWDFARHLQKFPALAAIPLVVITCSEPYWGYPGPLVLRKPLDLEQLMSTIRGLLDADEGNSPPSGGGARRSVRGSRSPPS
jgi:DNA-binding NtrC family response regulator